MSVTNISHFPGFRTASRSMSVANHNANPSSSFVAYRADGADTPVCCAIRASDFLGSVSDLTRTSPTRDSRFLSV
jgi:hypothetical protein